ncbi:MAG: hydroxyphenylacetyl-CoA thioesterase PaaI [Proteobacteria bacterium]|nr:hydroxyphenylacetyl-CoA thioesterase PaaI [Pseudomonadota bacterium]
MVEPRHLAAAAAEPLAQRTAERVRDRMLAQDHAARALGIEIVTVGPGSSRVRMPVRQDMMNGFAMCHGGLIATLADTAFAYACNAYNEITVASGLSIDFIAPAKLGDVLEATCVEQALSGRTGVYDVVVSNQRAERVALFRGRSYRIKGRPVVEAMGPAPADDET